MKKVRRLIGILVLFFTLFHAASLAFAEGSEIPLFPQTQDLKGDYDQYPIYHYAWDPDGTMGAYDPLFQLANVFMIATAFLVRLALLIYSLGSNPSVIGDLLSGIVQVITNSQAIILPRIWPFFALAAMAVLVWDYYQNHMQRAIQRGVTFFVVAVILGIYYNLTAPGIKMATDAVDTTANMFSSAIVATASPTEGETNFINGDAFLKTEQNFTNIVWKLLVEYPWQMGEFGQIDGTLANDADAVNNAVKGGFLGIGENKNAPQFSKDDTWKNVVLRYPANQKPRSKIAGILNDDRHPVSKSAFSSVYRLILSLVTFILSLVIVIFFSLAGLLLLFLFFYFIAALIAGVVIIPFSLIPMTHHPGWLRWWMKSILGSALGKIVIAMYIGLVFLIAVLINKLPVVGANSDPNTTLQNEYGFVFSLLINAIWFSLAILLFYFLYKQFQPVQRFNAGVDQKLGAPMEESAKVFRARIADRLGAIERETRDATPRDADTNQRNSDRVSHLNWQTETVMHNMVGKMDRVAQRIVGTPQTKNQKTEIDPNTSTSTREAGSRQDSLGSPRRKPSWKIEEGARTQATPHSVDRAASGQRMEKQERNMAAAGAHDLDKDHQDVRSAVLKTEEPDSEARINEFDGVLTSQQEQRIGETTLAANDQSLHERTSEISPKIGSPQTKESNNSSGDKKELSLTQDASDKIESDKTFFNRNQEPDTKKSSLMNPDPPKQTTEASNKEVETERVLKNENVESKEPNSDSGPNLKVKPGVQPVKPEVQAESIIKHDRKPDTDRKFIRRPPQIRKK